MTIALVGTGGLFARIGRVGKLAYDVNGHQATVITDLNSLYVQFDATTPPGLRDILAPIVQQNWSYITNQGAWLPTMQSLAQSVLLKMVQNDTPSAAGSVSDAIREVIRQMKLSSDSVLAATTSVSSSALAGMSGSGVLVSSNKRYDGLQNDLMFAEVGRLTCIADSYSTGSVAGNETFVYQGQISTNPGDVWVYDWPEGSDSATQFQAANTDNNTLISGGDFEVFTVANTPDSWTLAVGAAGTNCLQETTTVYTGASSLKWPGSATLTSITQTITPTGDTAYAAGVWLRTSGVPAAGVITVDLIDGSVSPSVINDDAGTANSFTVSLPGLTAATWTACTGVFRTPKALPTSGVKIRVRFTTALSAGTNLFLDRAILNAMTQAYTGGPYLAVISGATSFALYDAWSVTGANNRGGATLNATFQDLWDRIFNMRSLGLQLPTDASPTISDTLITA